MGFRSCFVFNEWNSRATQIFQLIFYMTTPKLFCAIAIMFVFVFSISSVFADDSDLDPYFLTGTGFSDEVLKLAIQEDGKVIAAGLFTNAVGAGSKRII